VSANSGTSATMLALDARGIGPGDEVIMATNAYIGVLAAVVKLGAMPVFVETDPNTGNISPAAAFAADRWGRIDILVNNGASGSTRLRRITPRRTSTRSWA
jgi:NAD(P)-dependent dehydrogenase (short-subunit alcohol dehydrogenase family)